jgi:hypothetical protein
MRKRMKSMNVGMCSDGAKRAGARVSGVEEAGEVEVDGEKHSRLA